jgi:MFS family permease
MLSITRAVLGVAGATLAPSTLSLIRNMFRDPDQRAFAIGVRATSFAAGAAIGPLAGGLLLASFWWGFCVPASRVCDGASARAGIGATARVPRSRGGQAGPHQCSDVIKSLIGVIGGFGT